MKKTLAILFGGCSSEYEVSLLSAAAVIRAVNHDKYELVQVGITRNGQWLLYPGGVDGIEDDSWWCHPACVPAVLSPSREDHGLWLLGPQRSTCKPLDLVFPVLHGKNGEDGTVQGLLEIAGIPFVGCGSLASAVCMDKAIAHHLAMQAGIACPKFVTLHAGAAEPEEQARQVVEALGCATLPWFVKPAQEGSSFGITRVEKTSQLPAALVTAFRYGEKVVVEQGVRGFEVGCAMLGADHPATGVIDAIQLAGGFFDFHEKYTLESARILLPAPLDDETTGRIKQTALELYQLFGCRGLARVDLFLTEDGEIIFNEVNTMPGMTPHSRYPGMMRQAGMEFDEMIDRILEEAMVA